MQLLSITMNCKYPLGIFKNVSLVQNKSLHVKYLPNVNSLEIIWSSFVLLILIKKREKSWKIRKIKILKSPQIQVKLVLDEIAHLNLHLRNNVTVKFYQTINILISERKQPPEVFLEISQNSQEITCVRVSFLIK